MGLLPFTRAIYFSRKATYVQEPKVETFLHIRLSQLLSKPQGVMDYLPMNLPEKQKPTHIFPPAIGAYVTWSARSPSFFRALSHPTFLLGRFGTPTEIDYRKKRQRYQRILPTGGPGGPRIQKPVHGGGESVDPEIERLLK